MLLGIPKKRLCFKKPSKQLAMCSTDLMENFLKNNILQQRNNNKNTIHKNQLSLLNRFSFTMTLTTRVFTTPHTILMITSFLSFSKSGQLQNALIKVGVTRVCIRRDDLMFKTHDFFSINQFCFLCLSLLLNARFSFTLCHNISLISQLFLKVCSLF